MSDERGVDLDAMERMFRERMDKVGQINSLSAEKPLILVYAGLLCVCMCVALP